ncbi:histidine kinase dimerization/phospho-acceptor domain-containing protein, partial [Acinetobacter baumannii]
AEAAARARDQFLAVVSHELRSPLNGIQNWAYVLESQIAGGAPLMQRALAGIKTGVEQQVRLIEDLLDAT